MALAFVRLIKGPVAAHLIGRAAHYSKVKLWEKTWIDQLAGHFSVDTETKSGEQ